MKRLCLILMCYFILKVATSQSILPLVTEEFCPDVEYTFTATIPKGYQSMTAVGGAIVTQLPTPPVSNTFTFKGKFGDVNQKQIFRIFYTDMTSYDFEFKKIKSIYYTTSCAQVPDQPAINVPRCQIINIPISVSNVQWGTNFENPILCFGSISDFEYQIPSGWSIAGQNSNGSNWIPGGNSVTVTSDASNGVNGFIFVRPRNTCDAGLQNGQIPGRIPILRSRPPLSITGDDFICSGSKNYTISGTLTPGSTVCWSSSNTNYATVPSPPNDCGITIPVSYVADGVINLNATVTDCIESYTLAPKPILIGATVRGYYRINSNYHNYGILYPLYNNNSVIWLPANQPFGVLATLNSPGLQSGSWTRAATSYPFTWSGSGTTLNFSGYSGSTAYEQRLGIFSLSAQTACGSVNSNYTWPVMVQGWGFSIAVSPNPAKDILSVSIIDEMPEVKQLSQNQTVTIILYDLNNTIAIKTWRFKNNQSKFNLNVSSLKKGSYILKVQKGKYYQSKIIVIE